MSRAARENAALLAQVEQMARRVALMSNAALSFREVIRKFGRHLPTCAALDPPNGECACCRHVQSWVFGESDVCRKCGHPLTMDEAEDCDCGWSKVAAFMSDDSNFGEVQQIQTIAVQDSKVILAR